LPDSLPTLLKNLQRAELFEHPVSSFRLIETHISYVLLTGSYAYKIKKPVNFGFVDFGTLQKRQYFCKQELRLNQRFAPDLYLGVVAITGSPAAPRLDGDGEIIEYAVKMRQFPDEARLDRVTDRDGLHREHLDQFAISLADFHAAADRAGTAHGFGTSETIAHYVLENFDHLRTCRDNGDARLLESWSRDELDRRKEVFRKRLELGFVRECHGDLHLANMVLIDDRIRLFDCLEFNDDLRWIDTASELAFLYMDLYYRGHAALAHRFFSRYLERTGDYDSLLVTPLYLSYRAMVRAKVACLRSKQAPVTEDDEIDRHIGLARGFSRTQTPFLAIMFGLSGSGKSVVAETIVEYTGAIRLRSDVERQRAESAAPAPAGVGTGRYRPEQIDLVYHRLEELAEHVISAGFSAVIDATFLKQTHRDRFRGLAGRLHIPFHIISCEAPAPELESRIRQRARAAQDPSEADLAVLEFQRTHIDPLSRPEQAVCSHIDTMDPDAVSVATASLPSRAQF